MKKLMIFDVDGVLEKEERIMKARKIAQTKAISKKLGISYKKAKEEFENVHKKLSDNKAKTTAYKFMYFGFTAKEYFALLDSVNPKGIISKHKNCTPLLRRLSKSYTIVTYSNASLKATKKTLKILKIDPYISKAYSSEQFSESKPSVKNLKDIAKDWGYKTKDCIFVGNSPSKDIVPAQKAGMTSILFDPYANHKNIKEADYIINNLIDILSLI